MPRSPKDPTIARTQLTDELASVKKLRLIYPNSANHPARTKPSRWFLLLIGLVFIGIGMLIWGLLDVPDQNKWYLTVSIAGFGVISAIAAALLPGSWAAAIGETLLGGNAIQSILASESRIVQRGSKRLLLEFAILLLLILLIRGAFELLRLGLEGWFYAVLVPSVLWAFSIIYRQKFRDSKRQAADLEAVIESRGYHSFPVERIAPYLKQSFLRSDLTLQVTNCWASHAKYGEVFWGRYISSGDSLDSGIFCGFGFTDRPYPEALGRVAAKWGTVYFDNASRTLFGTLRLREIPELGTLSEVGWQYLGNSMLAVVDERQLSSPSDSTANLGNSAEEAVVVWEKFCEELAEQLHA